MYKFYYDNINSNIKNTLVRRIDPDCNSFLYDYGESNVYCFGTDLVVKKYHLPKDNMSKLDLKIKFPINPNDEKKMFDWKPVKSFIFNNRLVF